jgi:hypothetical protein
MAESTETGLRWWMRYVIVPLLGGGGVLALIVAAALHSIDSKNSDQPQKPPAAIDPTRSSEPHKSLVPRPEATSPKAVAPKPAAPRAVVPRGAITFCIASPETVDSLAETLSMKGGREKRYTCTGKRIYITKPRRIIFVWDVENPRGTLSIECTGSNGAERFAVTEHGSKFYDVKHDAVCTLDELANGTDWNEISRVQIDWRLR